MTKFYRSMGVVLATVLAAACGGSGSMTAAVGNSTTPGSLAIDPPLRIALLHAATFGAELGATTTGAQLLQITGAPACGVDFYYIKFWTMGGAKESTESSGGLMVPTGGTGCSGARPILLYAHGTNTNQALNIAD